MSAAEVAAATGGRLVAGGPPCLGAGIDSRSLGPGQLFAALPGGRTDGHRFLQAAAAAGASGLLVASSRLPGLELPSGPFVVAVADPRAALARLARYWRGRLACRAAAVTGSFGKSTTKELLAALLGGPDQGVSAAQGSFNNDLGVPLTVLQAGPRTRFLVAELGSNKPGEIAPLAALVAPEVGIITGIGPVHLEGFGDEAGVAAEKGALAEALPADGRLILPAEDPWCERLAARSRAPVVRVALRPGGAEWAPERLEADAPGIRLTVRGRLVRLPLPGAHNALDLLLALAAADALGRPLEEAVAALAGFRPVPGRLTPTRLPSGVLVLDDTYNSNLPAARAALEVLRGASASGRRIAVLGAMAELGEASAELHRRLGEAAAAARPDLLLLVGGAPLAEAEAGALRSGYPAANLSRCADAEAAAGLLKRLARPGDLVLLKASRSERLERLLEALRDEEE